MLQKGPIELTLTEGPEAAAARGSLYFESSHSAPDIAERLTAAGIKDPQVTGRAELRTVFDFTGSAPNGVTDAGLKTAISDALDKHKDSVGKPYRVAEPIPETAVVGAQMVSELRDSAIKAILLSMFVTVIYIRVRFAEYSYGIAAVVALIHDILITIGVVALMVSFPLIHIEFDMSFVAVVLTIVGYSINDTIVVFDRIRENLPRRKDRDSLEKIVNDSINETFSRTVITSTSMCTILIVLLFNIGTGNVLESFSFAMGFGIATGTFSSIAIASPIFVWLEKRQMRKDAAAKAAPPAKLQPAPR
jgi:preprotein translocase SecF subunit